ncbi:MAG: phosphoribosylglycinamide formyltransferase [Chloroflexota bacterium]|nr:phosphoribosylglycinamide formyltransferase [Chloroflexota bacterium]
MIDCPQPANLVVLFSGFGSNLQAILDACASGQLAARVTAVLSDRKGVYGLTRARQAGVPAIVFPFKPYKIAAKSRHEYDAALASVVAGYAPDLVVLAGWMRVLSSAFLSRFPGRVVNLHPALPGSFPGTHAIERAYDAFRQGESATTGVMVHFVPDEGVDDGPVIAQEVVPILAEDTLETLEARVHQTEHRLLVSALQGVIAASGTASHHPAMGPD